MAPTLFTFAITHKTAPLDLRESFSLDAARITPLYQSLQTLGLLETCILSTCNRFEIHGIAPHPSIYPQLTQYLARHIGVIPSILESHSIYLENEAAFTHLLHVTTGIDSQILGENEIFGQVKQAYTVACNHHAIGPVLHTLFQKSFHVAKWIRTHTAINQGQLSIGSVAVSLALRIFEPLSSVCLLLIGAGQVAEQALQAFYMRGLRNIIIANRTPAHAHTLAHKYPASVITLDNIPHHLPQAHIILGSAYTPEPFLDHSSLEGIPHNAPIFLVDLALPRNFHPSCIQRPNTYLYNLDDLASIANHHLSHRTHQAQACEGIIQHKVTELWPRIVSRFQSHTHSLSALS